MVHNAFREFRMNLRHRGFYHRPTLRILLDLFLNGSLAIAGIAVFIMASTWLVRICALVVSTVGSIGVGTNTHTSSHYATSGKKWLNELLTYLGYPVYFGLPATYWWHKHVLIHHSRPNVIGLDGDADLSPWFATTADEVKRSSGARRFYYEHVQQFVFPVAIALTLFSQQIAGCAYLISSLGSAERRRAAHWIDAGALLAHAMVVLVIPMFLFPALNVIAFYAVRHIAISYGMFVVFAPAHMHPEAARLSKDLQHTEHSLAQTATTMNFRTGRFGRLICSGLEYQIEHHLLPDISYVYYPQVSILVEEFCRTHALPYRRYGLVKVLRESFCVIKNPVEIVTNSEELFDNNRRR